jgi:hypothetical protein
MSAGIGSQLKAYCLSGSGQDTSTHIFYDGTRIHGIESVEHRGGTLLVVHGGRHAKVRRAYAHA